MLKISKNMVLHLPTRRLAYPKRLYSIELRLISNVGITVLQNKIRQMLYLGACHCQNSVTMIFGGIDPNFSTFLQTNQWPKFQTLEDKEIDENEKGLKFNCFNFISTFR